jgi:hypothetical protein
MLLAVTLVVVVLSLRFGLGGWRLPVPYDVLKVSKAGMVTARVLSAGFLAVPLMALANPFLHGLDAPLPFGVLFCIPGLIAVHRLRMGLEARGNQAKPVMAWLDRGVLAGWTALGLAIVGWFFTTLPLLPSVV